MGVAVAVPSSSYDIMKVDITTIGDTKRLPRKAAPSSLAAKFVAFVQDIVLKIARVLGIWKPQPSAWKQSLDKANQMISLRLKPKSNGDDEGKPFVVGTYHMPCNFKVPPVMTIHSALSAQHIKRFAREDPYLFVGDFNIKPGTAQYRMLTEGSIEATVRVYVCTRYTRYIDS